MSLKENLLLAQPQATDEDLEHACEIACLTKDIAQFPAGYDTVVGEYGENLSGGQRQRLSLTRALLAGAPVMILDEYTSHLDQTTAAQVRANLATHRSGATIIEITHRLTDALDADHLAVIKSGQIVEQGDPHTLEQAGGAFATALAYARSTE